MTDNNQPCTCGHRKGDHGRYPAALSLSKCFSDGCPCEQFTTQTTSPQPKAATSQDDVAVWAKSCGFKCHKSNDGRHYFYLMAPEIFLESEQATFFYEHEQQALEKNNAMHVEMARDLYLEHKRAELDVCLSELRTIESTPENHLGVSGASLREQYIHGRIAELQAEREKL